MATGRGTSEIANAISIANGRKSHGNKFLNVLLQKRHAFDTGNGSISAKP
jgi:hypothetical protein